MTRVIRFAGVVAAVGLALGGCSPAGGQDPISPASSTAADPASPSQGEQALGDAVLGNGRHPVFLKTVDLTQRQITFDLIEFYTGAEAKVKWQQDHPGQAEEPALNGHYIRNNNTRLRSLPLADGAQAKVLDGAGSTELVTVGLGDVAAPYPGRPFWLTVFDGAVILVEEQFIP